MRESAGGHLAATKVNPPQLVVVLEFFLNKVSAFIEILLLVF